MTVRIVHIQQYVEPGKKKKIIVPHNILASWLIIKNREMTFNLPKKEEKKFSLVFQL